MVTFIESLGGIDSARAVRIEKIVAQLVPIVAGIAIIEEMDTGRHVQQISNGICPYGLSASSGT
ncbi:hypothetical protein ACMX24_39115 [Caballeronia sp. 15711]